MEKRYCYMACFDGEYPTLIRLGSIASMEADMYAWPGVWKNTPHLNKIRIGEGSFMDYDEISEKEAMELMKEIQERYDRMKAKKK